MCSLTKSGNVGLKIKRTNGKGLWKRCSKIIGEDDDAQMRPYVIAPLGGFISTTPEGM